MTGVMGKAVLCGLWLAVTLALPLSAEELDLGEATLSMAQDWRNIEQRRDVAAVYSGPDGESLSVFWWMPDEPLLGYEDEVSHETRSFPAGPALVVRSQYAGRAAVQVAFERESADQEQLLFLIESETASLASLESALESILQGLRFKDDPAPAMPVPLVDSFAGTVEGAGTTVHPAVSFDTVLAALRPSLGDDCVPVDPSGLPANPVLAALSLVPEVAAVCAGQGATILVLSLPQDPRRGQAGLLGMVYLRSFLAQGRKPLVFVDQAHGALVLVTATNGASIAVEVSELADLATSPAAADATAPLDSALPAREQLFSGELSATWLPHEVRGGNFDDWARLEGGMLSVELVAPPDSGATGLKSAEPMVTLPLPGDRQSVRLRFDFDTATTNNAVFALVPPAQLGKLDWDGQEIWVAIEQKRDASPELVLAVQRKVQGRYPLASREDLKGLTLELRPDGMVLLSNEAGRLLLEGRMDARPAANDMHLQVSATSPGHRVPARLDLSSIVLERVAFDPENDPALILGKAPQAATLFDGRTRGPHFAIHGPRGADLTGKLSIVDGLRVASPKGDGLNGLGIYAPEPVVWLDRFTAGASVRLRFEFDPAETSGFRLALAAPYSKSDGDPGFPRFVLDWYKMPDGTITASRWIDRELERLDATPKAMPAVVELVLTPDGVQVLADGFPADVLAWDALREGQGFRLYVLSKSDKAAEPVALALNGITLNRTPGTDRPTEPQPMPGVEPLPVTRHFPDLAAPWEPYGLAGLKFEESGHFDGDGGLIVEVEAKYEGGRAGILSPAPVVLLDERIEKTPYRLTLRFDPLLTDGAEVILSGNKVADMWKGSEAMLSLIRQSSGRYTGHYVLSVTKDYYEYWIRSISAQDMARWDGTMMLDLSPGTFTVHLPGVVSQRGTGFVGIAKGAEFHMVVQSRSDLKYGPARMALRHVEGEWIMPDGMSSLLRMELIDPAEFDAEAYLDVLIEDLEGEVQ